MYYDRGLTAKLGYRLLWRNPFGLGYVAPVAMSSLSGAIPFPATKDGTRARTRVDHRNSEEAALVRRVQARDEMAFREIVERYQAKVFSIIYGILRNRNDAEDIAQQVFAKIYFSIRNFDFRSSLLTWIYKITVNECYDYLRKKRVRKLVYESDFSAEDAQRMEASDPLDRYVKYQERPHSGPGEAAVSSAFCGARASAETGSGRKTRRRVRPLRPSARSE